LKSKIAIFSHNQIGSKSQFLCTTEEILSVVAFCSFTLPCCYNHSAAPAPPVPPLAFYLSARWWLTAAWLWEGHGRGCFSLHSQLLGNTESMAVYINVSLITWQWHNV